MSLAERLSVMEEYECLRDPSPAGASRRKMSFNPLPAKWVPPEENVQPVGAFEVSSTKRIGMFTEERHQWHHIKPSY
jgi:hypothetical protein